MQIKKKRQIKLKRKLTDEVNICGEESNITATTHK